MITSKRCPICATASAQSYVVHEQMLGTFDSFDYAQCTACGIRYLVAPPNDLARYYPASYVGFGARPEGFVRSRLRLIRNAGYFRWNPAGALRWLRPDGALDALGRLPIRKGERIVDVGCGSGVDLHHLAELGFTNLSGVDPYVPATLATVHDDGVTIYKGMSDQLPARAYDVVFANHVFEHVAEPFEFLEGLARIMAPHGRCLLRTPIADSWAAEHYGPHWVQHDAPRHFVIHTERSIARCAKRVGLRVSNAWYDSTAFQFWGSEAYRTGASLNDTHQARRRISLGQLWATSIQRARAAALNRQRRGDQACFVLAHDSP